MSLPRDWFAGPVAERYDSSLGERGDPAVIDATAGFLAELAGGGALELGIGTGRIALPLAERGVRVQGIDLSPDMVAQLRAKPGGDAIPVAIGDFATTTVGETFSLVYVVFNTINNLTTQDAQVACFENAAAHLEPRGCFVVEVGTPSCEPLRVFNLSGTHVGVDEYDAATQRLVSHHFSLADGRWERLSMPFRSVSPAELDLMARIAGMRLRERWGGWRREPFTSESTKHVSVWELRGSLPSPE
jgi:SAM-dependent methyltransferase